MPGLLIQTHLSSLRLLAMLPTKLPTELPTELPMKLQMKLPMKLQIKLPAILTTLLFAIPTGSYAEDFTSLSAHQHGHGFLSLALDNNQLFIELTAPAINLLGVEHRPTDAAASKLLQQKANYLKSLQWLRLSQNANCQVASVELLSPLLATEGADTISGDGQQITDPLWQTGEKTASEKHSAADHDHQHETNHQPEATAHDHASSHSDLIVSASFRCTEPSKLSEVTVDLWERSAQLNELSAQWILPKGQGAAELTKSSPTVNF